MSDDNQSNLAVVTGAGSGLGREFCLQLAREGGWRIVVADLDGQAAEATCSLVKQTGCDAEAAVFDVADAEAWVDLRERLRRRRPRLDLLVNNAGICMAAETGDGELADWRRIAEVNYLGVLNGCHVFTPWLKESVGGSSAPPAVINVASVTAWLAPPSLGAYSAAKAAVVALSEAMHAELRPRGVHVTVAAPGFFPSQLVPRGTFAEESLEQQARRLVDSSRITAAEVATATLAASRRGTLYVTLGRRARWLARAKRWAPNLVVRILAKRFAERPGGRR